MATAINPVTTEGFTLTQSLNLNQLNDAEYARGREEVVQYMRTRFIGYAVYVKKVQDKLMTNGQDANTLTALDTARSRARGCSTLYLTSGQINVNNVAQDTAAGMKTIGYKGKKIIKYMVPRTMGAGSGVDAGSFFTPSKINATPIELVTRTTNAANTNDINCPTGHHIIVDSVPAFPNGITNLREATTFEIYVYWYFSAFGKRVNV